MPIREQFAWFWLATLGIAYGAYFAMTATMPAPELPGLTNLAMLGAAAVAQMVAIGLFWLIAKARAGREGLPGRDERDRAIEHRSSTIAYYVLIAGTILVGCVMPFTRSGWELVNAAVLAIVVAELVHHGLVIVGYRRGWDG